MILSTGNIDTLKQYPELSLIRDWFAGMALQGISQNTGLTWKDKEAVANVCYAYANAMLKQREAQP